MEKKEKLSIPKLLLNLLSYNLGLKITSVVFAIVLWGFVMTEINPTSEKIFNDISLKYENANKLAEKELIISDDLDNLLKTVQIKVEANPDYIYIVDNENINAYVDLSLINGTGEQAVAIKATSSIGTVVDIKPKTITVNVEDYLTRIVPVICEINNSLTDSYYASTPVITPESIEIKGARSFVERISEAVCEVDLHEATKSIKKSYPVIFRNDEGEIIDSNKYKEDLPSVIVDLNILPQKSVPINITNSIFGSDDIAKGYIATNYWVDPTSVLVAAEQSILDKIIDVQIEGVDISGAKSNLSILTNIKPIEGAIITVDPKGVNLNIDISAQETTRIFESIKINAINQKETNDVSIVPSSIKVILTGEEELIKKIKANDIKLYIDVQNKKTGEYTIPVQIENFEQMEQSNFTLPIKQVKVIISNKE